MAGAWTLLALLTILSAIFLDLCHCEVGSKAVELETNGTSVKDCKGRGKAYDPLNWNLTTDYWGQWRGPKFFYEQYPIYLSGYDQEDRPIWIAEWGRFDIIRIVEGGEAMQEAFKNFTAQVNYLIEKSIKPTTDPDHDRNFVVDMDAVDYRQVGNPRAMLYAIGIGRDYREVVETKVGKLVLVNVNYPAQIGIEIGRQIFSSLFERTETFGTNKQKWIPEFRHIFPPDQIPSWYGGSRKHKPLFVLANMARDL